MTKAIRKGIMELSAFDSSEGAMTRGRPRSKLVYLAAGDILDFSPPVSTVDKNHNAITC